MPSTPINLDWLFELIGWLLATAGLGVTLGALFRDRSRGRRRCPSCWYAMVGLPGLRCPECGHEAASERRLYRTRRHWNRVRFGLGLVAAAGLVAAVPTYQRGWTRLVPGLILAVTAPVERGPIQGTRMALVLPVIPGGVAFAPTPSRTIGEALEEEAWGRAGSGSLWNWEAQLLLNRFLRRHESELAESVSLPERWPDNTPIPCRLRPLRTRIAVTPSGLSEEMKYGINELPSGFTHNADNVEFSFDLSVGTARASRQVGVPCRIVPPSEPLLCAESSPETDDMVRTTLRPYLYWSSSTEATIIAGDRSSVPAWGGLNMGIDFEVEIRLESQTLGRGTGTVEWQRPVWKDWQEITPTWVPSGRERAAANRDRLILVVRGRHGDAADQYRRSPFGKHASTWMGTFQVPAILPNAAAAPLGAPKNHD